MFIIGKNPTFLKLLFHPFSILQTCDPSAARAAWSGWGFPQFLSLPEERSDDCTPQGVRDRRAPRRAAEGVTGGHRVAWRLLSRGSRAQALGVVCQVEKRS